MRRRVAALKLLEELLEAGFEVEANRRQDRVVVRPGSRLTDALRDRIRDRKDALVAVLDPAPPEEPCPDCGTLAYARPPLGKWECLTCTELTEPERVHWFFGPLRWADAPDRPNGGS